MKNGKFAKRGVSTKAFAMILAIVALVSVTVGGTLAWLTAETTEVKNTFSTSNIGVELKETTTEYKMVPGWDIAKDPKAWVTEGSEAAEKKDDAADADADATNMAISSEKNIFLISDIVIVFCHN